jgi:hypothetical protein
VPEPEAEEETQPEIRYQPSVKTDALIAEEVLHPREGTFYMFRRFGSDDIIRARQIEANGVIYRPIDNDALRKGLVIVPKTAIKCTFEETYQKAIELASKIYDCPTIKVPEFRLCIAIAMASWFLDRFSGGDQAVAGMGRFAPIVAFRGASGRGKNRALNATRFSSYRPFFDQATTRIPSLFRPLDQWGGTLCIDECDLGRTDETAEAIHYLNCRCYGTPISRQNPDNPTTAQAFDNFGLTLVTQRRAWDDNATEDRTIPFYCDRSSKPIPTAELDEWIEEGLQLQSMLLYLRLQYWDKVKIDKAARIEGITDHRLTATVLPLLALKEYAPAMVQDLIEILKQLERRRRLVKAQSEDGIVINYLWDKIQEGLVGQHNGQLYVGSRAEGLGMGRPGEGKTEKVVLPLQTSQVAEDQKWKARTIRAILQSLQLIEGDVPQKVHLLSRSFRPIWFTPSRLEGMLVEFVVDYIPGQLDNLLYNVLGAQGAEGAVNPSVLSTESALKEFFGNDNKDTHPEAENAPTAPTDPDRMILSTDLEGLNWQDDGNGKMHIPAEDVPARIASLEKPQALALGDYIYSLEEDGSLYRIPKDKEVKHED